MNDAGGTDGDIGHPQEAVPSVMGLLFLSQSINGPAHRPESSEVSYGIPQRRKGAQNFGKGCSKGLAASTSKRAQGVGVEGFMSTETVCLGDS